ncbi:hypothetical protein M378DRAFT_158220 [Amanita muscaria Koide BX008]|uniref:Lariat debranching enzyme C-terminal domain-containing protein n=1 Tax=Amanita muscaria (strain Koide BX008) TaxID=946122 RepID=A0A0C2X2Q5_AMAMK|nr:hypothetical protein M378DRAFT_158220 [Amanita muscaria Koide BX008]
MKIAVQGCCHGDLDAIYNLIQDLESKNGYKVDVLLICGDFQAVRNHQDLQCMTVPDKYKEMKDFYKYYTGERVAPILTIVIGGNHEASNYMWELFHGGWLAPNIYYLGHAGCVQVNGVRIAGASGIFKHHDFRLGYYEKLPYDHGSIRSAYHIREFGVRRLSLLSSPRIFLSHDWPQSIEHYGDIKTLLRHKSFLRQDIDAGKLGSPPLLGLLKTLKPERWFAAHLHTYYEATVEHESSSGSRTGLSVAQNPDEIVIDDFDDETSAQPVTSVETKQESEEPADVEHHQHSPQYASTRFLALDKCLPRRKYLEVIDLDSDNSSQPPNLCFDPEWLAVTRAFQPWLSTTRSQRQFPDEDGARRMVSEELEWVKNNIPKKLADNYGVSACQTFRMTAPGPVNTQLNGRSVQPPYFPNPQTAAFCEMLEIENKIDRPTETI